MTHAPSKNNEIERVVNEPTERPESDSDFEGQISKVLSLIDRAEARLAQIQPLKIQQTDIEDG